MKLRIVPARTGLDWVKGGIFVFRRQPLAMAALFFMSMAAIRIRPLGGSEECQGSGDRSVSSALSP